jgi:HK97 family phage major capsid protein
MSTRAQERLREVEARMRSLNTEIGDAPLTDEQRTEWDALVAERGVEADQAEGVEGRGLLEEIRQENARRDLVRQLGAGGGDTESGDGPRPDRRSAEFMRRVEPFADPAAALTEREARDRGLKILELKDHTRHLDAAQIDQADRILRTNTADTAGAYVGRLMVLTEHEDYRSAFMKAVTSVTPAFTPEEARALNAVAEYKAAFRAMSGGTDASGGFGVPILIDPAIILTAQGSLNPIRKIARVETVTTDAWRGVTSAGVTWSYDGEAEEVSDDSPTLAQPIVEVHEARGFIPFSIRVGQDYPNFASEMSKLLVEGRDEKQAQMHAVGTGSGQPFGIITALDANTNVEVVVTTDGAFGGPDVNKVWGELPDRFKLNAHWVMNTDVGDEIASFGNGGNDSWFTVSLAGVLEQIKKRPVEYASYFPKFTGTTNAANLLVVGDFRHYVIAERVGMSIELVPHLMGANGRPTGQRGWFAYARDGADSVADNAFRLLQNQ